MPFHIVDSDDNISELDQTDTGWTIKNWSFITDGYDLTPHGYVGLKIKEEVVLAPMTSKIV